MSIDKKSPNRRVKNGNGADLVNRVTYIVYLAVEPSVLQALNETLHEHLDLQAPYPAACPSSGHPELHGDLLVQTHHQVASWRGP
jgi:hypothetical protein